MGAIEPSFEVDKKGRVICKEHSNYDYLTRPDKDFFHELYLEIELTCKTCSHYLNNDCYFPKSRIDIIEHKRQKKKTYICKLCSKRIDRMLSIVYKMYYKEMYDVEIPLICCDCYEKIKENEFLSFSKKLADFYMLNIVVSVFFLFYFVIFISMLKIPFIYYLIFVIPIISFIGFVVSFIIYKCLKKLLYLLRGIKYFKKIFVQKNID